MSASYQVTDIDPSTLGTYWDEKHFPYAKKEPELFQYRKIKIGQVEFFTVTTTTRAEQPKGRVIFVHGFAEYHKIYEEFQEDLLQQGYEVFFYDQRGSGLTSPGKLRGNTNFRYNLKDLNNFIGFNYDETKGEIPLFLLGHSMGGGIILNYLCQNGGKEVATNISKVKGAICCAPLVLLHPDTKPNILLEKLVLLVCKLKSDLPFDTKLNEDFFTNDKLYTTFLVNDALSKPTGTIGQLRDMILTGRDLLTKNGHSKFDTSKKLLILHSKDDHINWHAGSKQFFDKINELYPETLSNRKFIEFDGLRHSLFLETKDQRDEIIGKVADFLNLSTS